VLDDFFAALVVLLFLWNERSTVIAALAIPTSIVGTFTLVNLMGLTLNTLTLLALTLAVGIVIDDAIVVLENIVRWVEEKGYDPKRATIYATKEIGLAVLATTLSLVAVFLPVAFMSGIIGRFMASFGFTMSFSIMVSLLVSFTLTPMLCSRWLKAPVRPEGTPEPPAPEEDHDSLEIADPPPGDHAEERAQFLAWARRERTVSGSEHGHATERGGFYGYIERGYMWLLAHSMRHRWVIAIARPRGRQDVPAPRRRVALRDVDPRARGNVARRDAAHHRAHCARHPRDPRRRAHGRHRRQRRGRFQRPRLERVVDLHRSHAGRSAHLHAGPDPHACS
jgi:HAE1 family hydrophobic/amphiphilic exporter-1